MWCIFQSMVAIYYISFMCERAYRSVQQTCQEMQSLRDVIMYCGGARDEKKQSRVRSTTSLVPFSVSIFQARYLVARGTERETVVLVSHDECLPCFRQTLFPLLIIYYIYVYICTRESRLLALAFFIFQKIKIISCLPHWKKKKKFNRYTLWGRDY